MKFMQNSGVAICVALALCATVEAQEQPSAFGARVESLVSQYQRDAAAREQERKTREEAFRRSRDQQLEIVQQLRTAHKALANERAALEKESTQLKEDIAVSEQRYKELLTQLGDFPTTINRFQKVLEDFRRGSFYEAFPTQTSSLLKQLADARPSQQPQLLHTLWSELVRDIALAVKVSSFEANVVTPDGEQRKEEVVLYGPFQAVTASGYAIKGPDPVVPGSLRVSGSSVDSAEEGNILIDRSRGRITEKQMSSLALYLEQGGPIGVITLLLGLLGLVIAAVRMIVLRKEKRRVAAQIAMLPQGRMDNSLGRVALAVQEAGGLDAEASLHVVESILAKEIPALERGQRTLKLIAATAPLLGLLGTVTGMIVTFQSISVAGTNPALMAFGIAQALVTTMFGLIVAIPILFLHSILASLSGSIISLLEERALGLIAKSSFSQEETTCTAPLQLAAN